jgi:hypothetical protein
MWKVFVLASLLGSGSWAVEVWLSGIGDREGSGTIFSAVLEMGSRALTSLTEAKLREKTAGRTAAAECEHRLWRKASLTGLHTYPPRSQA